MRFAINKTNMSTSTNCLIYFLIMAFASILLTACNKTTVSKSSEMMQTTNTEKLYRDELQGYSIALPSGWDAKKYGNTLLVAREGVDTSVMSSDTIVLTFEVSNQRFVNGGDERLNSFLAAIKETAKNIQIQKNVCTHPAGIVNTCLSVKYVTNTGYHVVGNTLLIQGQNQSLIISAMGTDEAVKSSSSVINNIIQSFKFAESNTLDNTAQNNQATVSKVDELESIKADSSVNDARVLNAEGVRLSKQGNIEQALSIFAQAAQLNPNDGEILGNLSYSYYQLGNYDQSEQVLNRALNIKPKRGASWILMGQLRSVRGDLSGAVDSLNKYLTYSSRKSAAIEQLSGWANGYGDGANIPVLRQAAAQSLVNAGY